MIGQDFTNMFGGEEFFLGSRGSSAGGVEGGETAAVGVAFVLEFGPSFGFFFEGEWLLL